MSAQLTIPVKGKVRGTWVPVLVWWTPGPLKAYAIRRLIGFMGMDVTVGDGPKATTTKVRLSVEDVRRWKREQSSTGAVT